MTQDPPPDLQEEMTTGLSAEERAQAARFIKALNQAMLVQNVSQRKLCDLMGITVGTLTKYLRGDVQPLRVGTGIQAALAKVLGVTLDALVQYYLSGEYATAVSLEEVESWIRSEAGQRDLPTLMASLQAAGERWIGDASPPAESVAELPPYDWPLLEVKAAGISDRFRERAGLTDEALARLRDHGEFDEELVEAFSVACDYDQDDVRMAFRMRQPLRRVVD